MWTERKSVEKWGDSIPHVKYLLDKHATKYERSRELSSGDGSTCDQSVGAGAPASASLHAGRGGVSLGSCSCCGLDRNCSSRREVVVAGIIKSPSTAWMEPGTVSELVPDAVRGPKRYHAEPVEFASEVAFRPTKSSRLDDADLRIIDTLVLDGRANSRSMTSFTGLTEETIASRIRSLIDRDIIGITAVFDWWAAGYHWDLFVAIECGDGPVRPVVDTLVALDEVISISTVFGPVDLVVHALCHDRRELLTLLTSKLTQIDGIRSMRVMLTLDTVKFFHQFAWVPLAPMPLHFPDPAVELTDLDYSIINALVKNGRVSNREIGRALGVADGTVRTHLRRLESGGLLRVCAQVHPLTSGLVTARAFVGITVSGVDTAVLAKELARIAEVVCISLTSGHFDLFCYVLTRSRPRLIELVAEEIRPLTGVRSTQTWEVIDSAKHISHWARW